jgi:hypothetical protein
MNETTWPDDALDRAPFAKFLTSYLVDRAGTSSTDSGSFTVALDAGWGRGKSFFIKRWAQDLKAADPPYPVVIFDAWAADFSADPLIAFMASLRAALEAEIASSGLKIELKQRATELLDKSVKVARKALLPSIKYIGSAVLEKYSGVSIAELGDAVKEAIDNGLDAPSFDDVLDEANFEKLSGYLDAVFEKTLDEQNDKAAVISSFRKLLEQTIDLLCSDEKRSLPLFVFVDELDRCRPDFAIALLEGIKHLFGVRGVCFVVSTNREQLAEAMRAVYGAGYDTTRYLHRFFDATCDLPKIATDKFINLLPSAGALGGGKKLLLGLPNGGFKGDPGEPSVLKTFSWIASAFDLDLRSHIQVYEMTRAAAAAASGEAIAVFWLIFLCALRHRDQKAFEEISSAQDMTAQRFEQIVTPHMTSDHPRPFENWSTADDGRSASPAEKSVTAKAFAWQYMKAARVLKLSETQDRIHAGDYLRSVPGEVLSILPSNAWRSTVYPSPILHYFDLVKNAGFLSTVK